MGRETIALLLKHNIHTVKKGMMKSSFIPSSIQLAKRDKREIDIETEIARFDQKMTKLVEKIIKLSGCEQRYRKNG